MKKKLEQYGYLHFLLLPLFFVLHGWVENVAYLKAWDVLSLLLWFECHAVVLFLIFRLIFFKSKWKAAFLSSVVLALNFFFTVYKKVLYLHPALHDLDKYRNWLGGFVLVILGLIIFFKIKKKEPQKISQFLTFILLVFIVMDIASLSYKKLQGKQELPKSTTALIQACDSCSLPDIYLIVPDEYSSTLALKEVFDMDNSSMDSALVQRGFHLLPYSKSNYDITFFSMATMLNMDYLDFETAYKDDQKAQYLKCLEYIDKNRFVKELQGVGYQFVNLSPFNIAGQASLAHDNFLPTNTKLIADNTFLEDMKKETGISLWKKLIGQREQSYLSYKKSNQTILEHAFQEFEKATTQPKFVYTHIFMPHFPFYYDSNGVEKPFDLVVKEYKERPSYAYLSYVLYTNKVLLDLIDKIQAQNSRPKIILLTSDHGYRRANEATGKIDKFSNFNAVYATDGDYSLFTDSTRNINMLRKVINKVFHQQLEDLPHHYFEKYDFDH